jgi:pimeloyl-ACP methyl ester carboxylesterase
VEPFSIDVADSDLADLRRRISGTRWPDEPFGESWSQGTDPAYLRRLLDYWADGYDWRAAERWLNGFRQFRTNLDGATVHFVHERAVEGDGIPIVLTHGWPSSYVEYLPLVPLLTDPRAHGLDGPAFDVVIPSVPGYGFSPRPPVPVPYRYVARRWHLLMRSLGYDRYGASGGDWGAGVATYMAIEDPGAMLGIHLTTPEIDPYSGPGAAPWTPAEQAYEDAVAAWDATERGYSAIQSTKPQTLGYGLTDSPAGLAAWLVEKWRSWTDCGGDPLARFGDLLVTTIMIYWITGSITTSIRDYYDNRWSGDPIGPTDHVTVPTAFALFRHHFVAEAEPPREWAERLYDIRRWTSMPRGGHFAPAEEPELVAADLRAFFAAVPRVA